MEILEIKKPTATVITLGCKVNQYDSDAMSAVLLGGGFIVTEGLQFADVFIVNTCAVTAEAERKSRQTIGKILKLNKNAKIYICGCASQNNFSQFAKQSVEYISGTGGKMALAEKLVAAYCGNCGLKEDLDEKVSDRGQGQVFDKIIASDFSLSNKFEENDGVISTRTRHFIKIQDGCNNFCSYCIVPYLRGRSRSRSLTGILKELDSVSLKAKEVVLTGINLSAYGADINISLTSLLLALQKYDFRLRLGSLEVNVINRDFLDATKSLKQFCPHFHLSLQSGDEGVLEKMNRHYSTADYRAAVSLIREYYPNAGITTDIIVGFPTETEESFLNSLNFAKEMEFSDIHIFPYSSRKGTSAGKMEVIKPEIIEERQRRLTEVKRELIHKYLLNQLKTEHEVLFEAKEDGMWCGHTPNYVKVYSSYGSHNTVENVIPTVLYHDGIRV